MSFSAAWLALREPADRAARDAALLEHVRTWLAAKSAPTAVDLGSGTGSTVRAIGPRAAHWTLVDRDAALLAEASAIPDACTIEADLAHIDALPLDGAVLVTASALFDLAGRDWIEALADRIAGQRAGLYAALTYDGRMEWSVPDPQDAAVTTAFNRHQTGDKGLGSALGPAAGPALAEAMGKRGYCVRSAGSPWRLDADDRPLQAELLGGIARAAAEAGTNAVGWLDRRLGMIDRAVCTIGHVDLFALPCR